MKKFFMFLLCLIPWFISGFIFKYNDLFYNNLELPKFTLSPAIFSIIWFILYILIAISIFMVMNKTNIFKETDYFYVLITNYLANQLFSYVFFYLMSPILGFVMCSVTFISSIFLIIETNKLSKKACIPLIFYTLFSFYAFITSLVLYIINF